MKTRLREAVIACMCFFALVVSAEAYEYCLKLPKALMMAPTLHLPPGETCFEASVESNRNGAMVPPSERLLVLPSERPSLKVVNDSRTIQCRVIFQDVAHILSVAQRPTVDAGRYASSGQVMATIAYDRCPIPLPNAIHAARLQHRESVTISIREISDGLLYPSSTSDAGLLVGMTFCDDCGFDGMESLTLAPNYAVDTVWVFEKAGIVFATDDAEYTVIREGARLTFGRQGILLDGIEVSSFEAQSRDTKQESDDPKTTLLLPKTGESFLLNRETMPGTFVSGEAIAPLRITAQAGNGHYYIKLTHWVTGDPYRAVFLRAGETFETKLPVGAYEIKYATGSEWYGPEVIFGNDTAYFTTERLLHFAKQRNRINGYSVELIPQPAGNLPYRRTTEEEW